MRTIKHKDQNKSKQGISEELWKSGKTQNKITGIYQDIMIITINLHWLKNTT